MVTWTNQIMFNFFTVEQSDSCAGRDRNHRDVVTAERDRRVDDDGHVAIGGHLHDGERRISTHRDHYHEYGRPRTNLAKSKSGIVISQRLL